MPGKHISKYLIYTCTSPTCGIATCGEFCCWLVFSPPCKWATNAAMWSSSSRFCTNSWCALLCASSRPIWNHKSRLECENDVSRRRNVPVQLPVVPSLTGAGPWPLEFAGIVGPIVREPVAVHGGWIGHFLQVAMNHCRFHHLHYSSRHYAERRTSRRRSVWIGELKRDCCAIKVWAYNRRLSGVCGHWRRRQHLDVGILVATAIF